MVGASPFIIARRLFHGPELCAPSQLRPVKPIQRASRTSPSRRPQQPDDIKVVVDFT